MNIELSNAFSVLKPVCDILVVCPTQESVDAFESRVSYMNKEVVQELQQYLLHPLIKYLRSSMTHNKPEIKWRVANAIRLVLEKVKLNSFDVCVKLEAGLLLLIFDSSKEGMIGDVSEELKYSVMRCLTELMLNLDDSFREQLLQLNVALVAQVVYVAVHIAKLEKFRPLRLAAINCATAHTSTHERLMKGRKTSRKMERLTVDVLTNILPGVLAALQDVANSITNPGHAVIVSALDAIRRILYLTMNNKYATKKTEIKTEDFAEMIKQKAQVNNNENTDVSRKDLKDVPKRTSEWYAIVDTKLIFVTQKLVMLRTHEHFLVRKELAVLCTTLITNCNDTMPLSTPLAIDVIIALSKDEHPHVSRYCTTALNSYFNKASRVAKQRTMDVLCDNFYYLLTRLPRVLNNIDSSHKVSSLNLLVGYIEVLSTGSEPGGPQRLTSALSTRTHMQALCDALLHAAELHHHLPLLARRHTPGIMPVGCASESAAGSPWARLVHCSGAAAALAGAGRALGGAACGALLLDALLERLRLRPAPEHIYVLNLILPAPNSSANLVKRVLNTYIEEDLWYLPLEVGSGEGPITREETYDVTVYNPRAWIKECVPDLYEGAIETRYTDISYRTPRLMSAPGRAHDGSSCPTLGDAQHNMLLSCLLTEGVGIAAKSLMHDYQPYLLNTLCLILERVGSKYEMLHLAGSKAINDIATACGHSTVAELIQCNADYFTSQITGKLKKPWNCQSALQILTVVMEYSDSRISDCLYGIVQDVLVQSCDKYYQKDLYAYLQVFLTFIECIRKWYPHNDPPDSSPNKNNDDIDVLVDVLEYIKNTEESERLLSASEFERESGKSLEEMYNDDMKKKEDDSLDYDDTVSPEKPPLPQYVLVTIIVLKRCLNFITSQDRDEAILALQVINKGLPILRPHDDELLPLVHLCWAPLVARFEMKEPVVMRRAVDLLVTMADVSKDFIRSRTVKEVLPHIYTYLRKSAPESYLKDAGSMYRNSQAYSLQVTALDALPHLVVHLGLEDEALDEAMFCVDLYLSKKQPKPLQKSAVLFFKSILDYDYGAAWHHLRKLCGNDIVLQPPLIDGMKLQPVVGTPYLPVNKDYETNVKSIFNLVVS